MPARMSRREQLAPDGDSVDKCAVVTLKIDQMKCGVRLADGEVMARDGAIAQAEMIGGISPHRKLIAL